MIRGVRSMSDEEDFEWEHPDQDGDIYEKVTKVYENALSAATRGKGKKTKAAYERAYAQALAEMEQAHGPTSDEALAALFYLARFRNNVASWFAVFDRERERY